MVRLARRCAENYSYTVLRMRHFYIYSSNSRHFSDRHVEINAGECNFVRI